MSVQRILIVDDNEDHGQTLRLLLARPDREIQYATNPLYALDLVTRWRPHVIFLDIGLPDMDGYQAAQRFRRALPDVRLYAITGLSDHAGRQRAMAAGFADHFRKPLDPTALERVLASST
jgi:CheY-like chemotaxis protein